MPARIGLATSVRGLISAACSSGATRSVNERSLAAFFAIFDLATLQARRTMATRILSSATERHYSLKKQFFGKGIIGG